MRAYYTIGNISLQRDEWNMKPTNKQSEWFRMHNVEIEEDRNRLSKIISESLNDAYNAMSELENTLNNGMNNAGYDTYALSRNHLHSEREEISHMAKRFGLKHKEYPINLIGGQYKE